MGNPVDIEKQYQELLLLLSFPVSPRERLFQIKEFVGQLIHRPDESESYLLEVLQYLPDIVDNIDIEGIDPHIPGTLYENLNALHNHLPSLSGIIGFERAVDTLRFKTAQLYAFAGHPRMMLAFLNPRYANTPPKWLGQIEQPDAMITPYELIHRIADLADRNNDTVGFEIRRIIEEWEGIRSVNDTVGIVPVIELSYGNIRKNYGGVLRRIHVNIIGETNQDYDEIHPDIAVYGARSQIEQAMNIPVVAARNLIAQTHPHIKNRCVGGHIHFDNRYAMHGGASANAAIAALIYCSILKTLRQRTTFRIASGVAITGNVNEEGEILTVDEDALIQKVRAIMFSAVDYLVVPEEQLSQTVETVTEAQGYYPGRTITVIGISHLREIFYDRRLTERKEIGTTQYFGKKIWAQKFSAASIVTIILLLIIIGRLAYGPLDRNPVLGQYEGKYLVLYNKYNQVIERIWVGEKTIEHIENIFHWGGGADSQFALYDITGDGYNEIIWYVYDDPEGPVTSVIYCKSLQDNNILWEYPVQLSYPFPSKPYVSGHKKKIRALIVEDLNNNGLPEIIVVGVDATYFPGFVLRLDPLSGELNDYYINSGGLKSPFATDITGNGVKEIIVGGINNAFEEAVIIILDPFLLSGHSPVKGDYVVEGLDRANEVAYIRIPRTVVGDVLRHRTRYNMLRSLRHNSDREAFQAYIIDYRERKPQSRILQVEDADIIISFDYQLNVKHIGTTDNYDIISRLLYEEGHLESRPDYQYFQEYAKTLLYWNGDGWQNEPTFNKRYLMRRGGDYFRFAPVIPGGM